MNLSPLLTIIAMLASVSNLHALDEPCFYQSPKYNPNCKVLEVDVSQVTGIHWMDMNYDNTGCGNEWDSGGKKTGVQIPADPICVKKDTQVELGPVSTTSWSDYISFPMTDDYGTKITCSASRFTVPKCTKAPLPDLKKKASPIKMKKPAARPLH